MNKKKILIIANAVSLAHPTRMWVLARMVDKALYEIHFATSAEYKKFLLPADSGIFLHHIECESVENFSKRLYNADFLPSKLEMDSSLRADMDLIDRVQPDCIIADFRYTIHIAARFKKVRLITLSHYYWSPDFKHPNVVPSFHMVDKIGRKACTWFSLLFSPVIQAQFLNKINTYIRNNPEAQSAQIPPFKSFYEYYVAGDYVAFADLPSMFPNRILSESKKFIGPILWSNPDIPWPDGWPEDFGSRPVAYVTLGSTGSHATVPMITKVLQDRGYQVLISSSLQSYVDIDLGDALVAPFVPADRAIRMAKLLVCNGGCGTTYHAIARGVPFVPVATNMDQCLNSINLEHRGLCKMIHADQITVNRLSESIDIAQAMGTKKRIEEAQSDCLLIKQDQIINDMIRTVTP